MTKGLRRAVADADKAREREEALVVLHPAVSPAVEEPTLNLK
jgi:hypothetical protein